MRRLGDAVRAVRGFTAMEPRVGIILGTGLGALADQIDAEVVVSYDVIPGFTKPTVESHAGRLIFGTLAGTPVVAMQGRFHVYEGYSQQEITFPVRVMRLLGADTLIATAACGGMNPLWAAGELILLDDHINMLGSNPLIGPNLDELGPRFPDMSEPYDRELQTLALDAAMDLGIKLNRGVYVAWTGPALETRAEYRMLRALGADAVGMSTVPEVIAARHAGMRVLGLCIITDECLPDALAPVDVPKIIEIATNAQPDLTRVVSRVVGQL
jgi:purine-nucleoside phosphorylase